MREEPPKEVLAVQRVASYARVSSHEHRENLERQAERMISYGAAKGYQDASRRVSKWYVRPDEKTMRAVKGYKPVQEGESAK